MGSSIIGIDFGTSYTYIYSADLNVFGNLSPANTVAPQLYGDYNRVNRCSMAKEKGIKTIIGLNDDDDWVVGWEVEEAIHNGTIGQGTTLTDGNNVERDIKKKLRAIAKELSGISETDLNSSSDDSDKNRLLAKFKEEKNLDYGHLFHYLDGTTKYFLATDLAKKFVGNIFKYVLEKNKYPSNYFHKVEKIVIGMPAIQGVGESYRDIIRTYVFEPLIAEGLFAENVKIVVTEEPILACRACMTESVIESSKAILVIDIGGGTADYAILNNSTGGLSLLKSVGGGEEPAGRDIDFALKKVLHSKLGTTISDADMDIIMNAKEELFKSKKNIIAQYRKRYIKTEKLDETYKLNGTEENLLFANWINYVRRTTIQLDRDIYYIAFNSSSISGNEIKYFLDVDKRSWESNGVVLFEDELEKVIKEKFIDGANGIKSYTDSILNGQSFDTVIFVGGTSNIMELRNSACKVLGLEEPPNGIYENGNSYKLKNDSKFVRVLFTSEAQGKINCSNAVAYGALLQGVLEFNLTWEPKFKLRLAIDEKEKNRIIWSQQIKENNAGEDDPIYANVSFKEAGLEFKKNNPNKKFKVQFYLEEIYEGQKSNRYPKTGYFKIPLTDEQIKQDVQVLFFMNRVGRWNKYAEEINKLNEKNEDTEKLITISDTKADDNLRLYVFIDDQSGSLIDLQYTFVDEKKIPHVLDLEQTKGTRNCLKCYDLTSSIYRWGSPLNKEGFEKITKE